MKIGASTLASTDLEKFLDYCVDLNLDFVEIVKSYPNHDLDVDLLISYDFPYSVHSPLIDMNICSLTRSIREASMQELKDSIDDAARLGARNVVIHPGKVSFLGQPYKDHIYEICVDSFKEIHYYSSGTGVMPLIENMPMIPGFMYTDINRLNSTLDNLDMFMTFDIGHAYTAGFSENEMYFPRIKHIHLHDNNGDDDSHLPLGEGSIDLKQVLYLLDEKNYKGTYIIEANNPESLKISLEYLKNNNFI